MTLICVPQASMSIFVLVPYCLITVAWQFEIRRCDAWVCSCSPLLLVGKFTGISHTIYLQKFFFITVEKSIGILIEVALTLQIVLVVWTFINSFDDDDDDDDIFVCAFLISFIKSCSFHSTDYSARSCMFQQQQTCIYHFCYC